MMLKKIVTLLLIPMLLGSVAFASEETKEIQTYTLTLAEAIQMATEGNPQILACEIKKDAGETSLEVAKINRRTAKNSPVAINDLIYVKNGYTVAAAEMSIRLAELEAEQLKHKISYQVTEKYFNVKLAEQLLGIYQNAITMAEENYNIVNQQLQLGMVSELEVKNADVQVRKNKLSYENALRNIAVAKEDLKIALQITEKCDFVLTDEITYQDYESDVDQDIVSAMDSRYDVNALKEKAALDELYFTITDKMSAANTEKYKTANSTHVQSRYAYENNSKLIGLSIRATYNNIAATKGNMEIAALNLEIKNREYETAKLKFQMGMLTNIELTKTQTELLQCQTELENAKLSYKLSVEKYQYEITLGL